LDNYEEIPKFIKKFSRLETNYRNYLAAHQEFVEERSPPSGGEKSLASPWPNEFGM
jgi:hypothetical protein